jgi:hypothetical protein
MPRPLIVFITIVCVGAMLSWFFVPLVGDRLFYWLGVAVLGGLGAVFLGGRRVQSDSGSSFLSKSEFLCDSCRYDNARDCSRPERPNAARCEDYRRR